MDIGPLDVEITCPAEPGFSGRLARGLRAQVFERLQRYPYFAVLKNFPESDNSENVQRLSRSLGYYHPYFGLLLRLKGRRPKPRITRIAVTRSDTDKRTLATKYSRTASALAPHTDGTFLPRPYDMLILQCVLPDEIGGETILVAIDDIIAKLSSHQIYSLREAAFPFGGLIAPVLSGPLSGQDIRYYRGQIDHSYEKGIARPQRGAVETLEFLDQILRDPGAQFQFKLAAGDVLIVNNKKTLHGRTGLPEDSERLLFRSRIFSRHV